MAGVGRKQTIFPYKGFFWEVLSSVLTCVYGLIILPSIDWPGKYDLEKELKWLAKQFVVHNPVLDNMHISVVNTHDLGAKVNIQYHFKTKIALTEEERRALYESFIDSISESVERNLNSPPS